MNPIFTQLQWSTKPVAYWTIQYEYKRSGADMLYRFWWNVWLKNSASWYYDGLQLQLFLNGTQKNVTVKGYDSSEKGWNYVGLTEWYTVPNKTSGSVSFYAKLYDTNAEILESTSPTYSLTVSGAASEVSVGIFDVDSGAKVAITKYDSAFTDTLKVYYGSTLVKTVTGIKDGANVAFTASELSVVYNLMTAVKAGLFKFEVTSTHGGTTIGTNTTNAIGKISGANPTFLESQVGYSDTNGAVVEITGNPLLIVQNKSLLTVNIGNATGNKGATISKYVISINTEKRTAWESGSVSIGKINSAQDQTLTVTVEDSRGNTTTVTKNVTMLAWSMPVFSATVERLNNYEDETYVTVNANVSSVNGKNKPTITYKFKQSGGNYGSDTEIENRRKYTTNCDKNYVYTFSITVSDLFGSVTKEYELPKGKFPLFIDTEKAAVGINEFPSDGEALRVAGGVACFEEGIVLMSGTKKFKITINDSGAFVIAEL